VIVINQEDVDMWLVSIAGIATMIFAAAVIVRQGWGDQGKIDARGRGFRIRFAFPALALFALGAGLLVIGQVHVGLPGLTRASANPKPRPFHGGANRPGATAKPSNDATATPTPDGPASTDPAATPTPTPTPTPVATPAPTPDAVRSHGPWEDRESDVHLVVEKVQPGQGVGGRLKINLRLENDSVDDMSLESANVSVVDSLGRSYSVDTDHSSVTDSSWGDDIESGHATPGGGYIILDGSVPRSADSLSLRVVLDDYSTSTAVRLEVAVPLINGRRTPQTSGAPTKS
jgi:hypothetical protein